MTRYGLWEAMLDGVDFCARDISVLPGDHTITGFRKLRGTPYNCYSHQQFDQSGYDSCRDDREEEIQKGESPSPCYTSTYTRTKTRCTVPFSVYRCESQVRLKADQ